MRVSSRYIWTSIAAAGMFLYGPALRANEISVDYSPATTGGGVSGSNTAGVDQAGNWNNVVVPVSHAGTSGSANALNDSTGSPTGVNSTYSGGSFENNPRVTAGGSAGDNQMMAWGLDSGNKETLQGWFDSTHNANNYATIQGSPSWGPTDVHMEFTNLNAEFPNGYNVYVYVKGTSLSYHSGNGATGTNAAAPLDLYAGGTGLNAFLENGGTPLQFGANSIPGENPGNTQAANGVSADDPATIAANGYKHAMIWPTNITGSGTSVIGTANWAGSYVTSPSAFTAVDATPLDWGGISGIAVFTSPSQYTGIDYPLYSSGNPTDWTGYATGGPAYYNPASRGIPVGNYVEFTNMSLNTLDILSRNLAGENQGGGSNGQAGQGGISGIQIVGIAPVPEPSTLALLGVVGLAGLARFIQRRRRC